MITAEYNRARNLIDAATSSGTYANDVARMANQYCREGNIPAAKAAYISAMQIFQKNLIAIDDLPQMPDQHIQSMKTEERLELMENLIRVTYQIPDIVSDIENNIQNVWLTNQEVTEGIWYHNCIYIGNMKTISSAIVQKADLLPHDMEVNEDAKRNILKCYESGQRYSKASRTPTFATSQDHFPGPESRPSSRRYTT